MDALTNWILIDQHFQELEGIDEIDLFLVKTSITHKKILSLHSETGQQSVKLLKNKI